MKQKDILKFITTRDDWLKLWDFYFSIWFLDRLLETHIRYPKRLGYENRNTVHIFSKGSESAYFLQDEMKELEESRKKKLLSSRYMASHVKGAEGAISRINVFANGLKIKVEITNISNLQSLFKKYRFLLEDLLSFYRASRPEIFEIIEKIVSRRGIDGKKREYLKKLIKQQGKLRFKIKKTWLMAERRAMSLKKVLARKIGLSVDNMEYLTMEEILDFLSKKIYVTTLRRKISQRQSCIFGIISGKKFFLTGKSFSVVQKHVSPKIVNSDILMGKPAYPGKVFGKVRIIPQTNYQEMLARAAKFRKGEILITGMTQPDIVTACRKAAAIITDEGGITSHAAIIARELGIPAVIGTKVATKILKDGDLVEVQANHGVIKILRRK